ncbi:guanylate kinase [Hominifimenecus sp. rT4P-3]|uniref:guanylate kinase n=1 Tax=Hominifimenecus sp. rT4P-3 TaxID=3242979 RepID=UPI003DA407F1
MGKVFYIFGKSASGKDSIFQRLLEDLSLGLRGVTMYTTRPMRLHEQEGVEYHFISEQHLSEFREQGRIIEERTYQTMHGPWTYATIDDGQIDLRTGDYLMTGVLESYLSTKRYFGADWVVPLYIEVEDGERLRRALERERKQACPRYSELCRRFLADETDFAEERLHMAGVEKRYQNENLAVCLTEIRQEILSGK